MGELMMANGLTNLCMVKEFLHGKMEENIKDNM